MICAMAVGFYLIFLILQVFLRNSYAKHKDSIQLFHYPEVNLFRGVLSDEWSPMQTWEAANYLNLHEICAVLGHNHEICKREALVSTSSPNIADCEIGMAPAGSGEDCPNPLALLMRHNSTKPWPSGHNMLDLIRIMRSRGSNTLVIVGDSISGQFFRDSYCSLRRFGIDFKRSDTKKDVTLVLRDPSTLVYASNGSPDYFKIVYITDYGGSIVSPKENLKGIAESFDFSLFQRNDSSVMGKLVFVMNIGLHFNPKDEAEYRETIRLVMKYYLETIIATRNHFVIFRETSAQHFNSPNGGYEDDPIDFKILNPHYLVNNLVNRALTNYSNLKFEEQRSVEEGDLHLTPFALCEPLTSTQAVYSQNWRNRIVIEILKELDPHGKISIASFYHISAGRHDMHLKSHDCTHFCVGPMLWLPLWNNLVQIVQERL